MNRMPDALFATARARYRRDRGMDEPSGEGRRLDILGMDEVATISEEYVPEPKPGDHWGPWHLVAGGEALACYPYPNDQPYAIDLDRIERGGVADWVRHLASKSWDRLDGQDRILCFIHATRDLARSGLLDLPERPGAQL